MFSAQVAAVIESLERDMELLCITGVEDKLQDNVRNTLEQLRNAGIRQGPLSKWTEHFTQSHFVKLQLRGRLGRTPEVSFEWIFWTMPFYNLKKFTSRSWGPPIVC